ncbi:MAG: nitroreductase family protein [Candidatus Aenigmatarchaeota archaeon]
MPFDTISKFGKGKKEVQTMEDYVTPQPCETLASIIKNRRSVRRYLKGPIPQQYLERILESAKYAPSAGNYQPWELIVVKNEDTKKDIVSGCYNQTWMLEAPVFIIVCTNMRLASAVYGERGAKLYGTQSVAAAIENMLLTAESLSIGSCWVGAFSEVIVSRVLECPEYARPCAIITMGYPAEEPKVPPKQSIRDFVHLEKFGDTLIEKMVGFEKKPTYIKLTG